MFNCVWLVFECRANKNMLWLEYDFNMIIRTKVKRGLVMLKFRFLKMYVCVGLRSIQRIIIQHVFTVAGVEICEVLDLHT